MIINRNFKDFKFRHRSKKNQIIYTSKKVKNDDEVINLIDNFLIEKNSFIFESVEKGKIKGRYTIFGKNPDKIWEFNNKNSYLIKNKKKIKTDGSIDFISGNKILLSDSIFNHQPKVGDVLLFPHYLMHTAYPFKSDGERRSFSFNLEIDKKIANVFSK